MSGSTTLLKLIKPTVSGDADVWGGYLNTNFDSIDKLIDVITTTGSANAYVLTSGQTLTAYATGQRFRCKLNFTCSGSSTLNVDSIGAKTIKKRDATTNVSSGDLVSGQIYAFTYDGTNFVMETDTVSDVQPLDATLTALAALSWSSGNALLQFTAADTVSLTLTPSVSSVTASQGAAATTASGRFVNTTDNAAVRALIIEGDRATPTSNDLVYAGLTLSNAAGTQVEFGRVGVYGTTLTNGAEAGLIFISSISAGAMAERLYISPTAIRPVSNDNIALGTATVGFSDLFLASGGVINWNNGTFTLTQAGAVLTASGSVRAGMALSSETSGTLTSASANTYIDASGGITLPNAVFSAGQWQYIVAGSSSRTITRGASLAMYVNGADSASCTLAARGTAFVFWDGSGTCYVSGDVS